MGFLQVPEIGGEIVHWEYLPVLVRLALALAIGLLVGMERERRGKEAGARTFALVSLLGFLGGVLGDAYAITVLALVGLLVVFVNWQRLVTNQTAELTTSAALLVTGFAGILVGKGHSFTPVTIGIVTAALLAWKERVTHFSVGLTEAEIRSAILLGIISFVVYPILPEKPLDPWGLIEPRAAWMTVILIAAMGFGNYVLLKIYGARGVEISGLLGGFVNSTVVTVELAERAKGSGDAAIRDAAYRGVMLATAAMLARNAALLGILAIGALRTAALPLALMIGGCVVPALLSHWRRRHRGAAGADPQTGAGAGGGGGIVRLESPFSLPSAVKYGLLFLLLSILGTLAQRALGAAGFYGVSVVGGLISSASTVASAGTLATRGQIGADVAAVAAILASFASAAVNLPLAWRISGSREVALRLARSLAVVLALGAVGVGLTAALAAFGQIP